MIYYFDSCIFYICYSIFLNEDFNRKEKGRGNDLYSKKREITAIPSQGFSLSSFLHLSSPFPRILCPCFQDAPPMLEFDKDRVSLSSATRQIKEKTGE